ncbi:MAG: N-acetyltransferase [Deltaproteobacteria bacterium]|nr:MAG: N-acetyltransferase [Deltaproteobacteria bacterium]
MIFKNPIETSRLILKPESIADFPRFYAMTIDPEVMKYIGDGTVFHWTEEVALEKYQERIANRENQDPWNLAVYRKDVNQYIGWCSIGESRFLGKMELSYRFCRDSWSKGYATEAAHAILIQTFDLTDIGQIFSCTHPENSASMAILKKLGFVLSYHILSRPINREMPVFLVTRETVRA